MKNLKKNFSSKEDCFKNGYPKKKKWSEGFVCRKCGKHKTIVKETSPYSTRISKKIYT